MSESHYLPPMLFWSLCAILTLAAVVLVLWPFVRSTANAEAQPDSASGHDLEVYKDQLAEVERDAAAGTISADDAQAARTEVARRILKLKPAGETPSPDTGKSGRLVATISAVLIPLIAWPAYNYLGSPETGDQPYQARMETPAGEATIEVLVAKTEKHLAEHPEDGKGWAVIAPIYLRTGQYQKALVAYEQATKSLGEQVSLEIGKGEAQAGLAGGKITAEASKHFRRAAEIAPNDPQPKIYLATELAQNGQYPEAKSAFESILAGAPADAPWRSVVQESIAQLDEAINNPQPQMPGPSASDVENAASMSEQDRLAMIEGMVAKLDARLKEAPDDKDGWLRLVRSYAMLKKGPEALDALTRARAALKDNSAALAELAAMAGELGLEKP